MKEIKILDCTLRDGGYINDWRFGYDNICDIVKNLERSGIDVIEVGFLRPGEYDSDLSVFSDISQITRVITPKKQNMFYAVMIENRNYKALDLPKYDGTSIDIIRVTFRRNEWEDAKHNIAQIISKGYKVCVQPVGSALYDDQSLLNLIKDVNIIKPYAFYIVDTLGVMYRHEMRKFYYLIDGNLSKEIYLGYHSHNNLQMAFSNAQEITRLCDRRSIILDASCYGMGRGVGNLTTELIADYINNNIEQKYSIVHILNIVDKYLMPIYAERRWGYDLPYFLSAIEKCHPNYATYLMKKETLSIEKIEKILSLIPCENRCEYDESLIEALYIKMQQYDVDDEASYNYLNQVIGGKDVVILGSGYSIITYHNEISKLAKGKTLISINFVPDDYNVDMLFISNEKRTNNFNLKKIRTVITTSNLRDCFKSPLLFNYSSLLGEGDALDNAGAMLIRILRKVHVRKVYIAGLDGFDVDASSNYAVHAFKKYLEYDTAKKKNEDISKQLRLALSGVQYEFITPTKYEV